MAFILGVRLQDLEHPYTDFNEILGVYRVDTEAYEII